LRGSLVEPHLRLDQAPFPVRSYPVRSFPLRFGPVQFDPLQYLPFLSGPIRFPLRGSLAGILFQLRLSTQSDPVRSGPVRSGPIQSFPVQSAPLPLSRKPG
jgi:hypothetical protein